MTSPMGAALCRHTAILMAEVGSTEAVRTGEDETVCGTCPLRPLPAAPGSTRCYVNKAHGPRVVYDAIQRGACTRVNLIGACAYVAGLPTRFGSWGDPGAVDAQIWHALARASSGHTGYTHRWADTGSGLRGIVMASVDNEAERDAAQNAGWSTFGVDSTGDWRRIKGEAQCPAAKESGKKTNCRMCPIKCDGQGLSVVIMDHGPSRRPSGKGGRSD